MKIANLDELKVQIRPFLKKYLSEHKLTITGNKFQCPNYRVHKNQDATPSAGFFSDGEHWNCFSCSGAGDIFTAAYYLENKPLKGNEFVEDNVLYLAKKYGVSYERIEETEEEKYQKIIFRLLETAAKVCHAYLTKKENKKAYKYIDDRGWNKVVKQFCLGYMPSEKLYKYLISEGFTDKNIVDSGLTTFKDNKIVLPIHVIEDRLVIPYRNYFGKISAFVSREIEPGSYAKYLHSHNSLVHKKSNDLFNLNEAKKYSDELYIVESNASVITLFANGVKNCVALSGKDLTAEQFDLLVRLNIKKIIICLDNDDAGIEGTEKIINDFKDKPDISISIKELPKGEVDDKKLKDPDDFVLKFGIEKFNNLPEISAFEWAISHFIEVFNDETKKNDTEKYKEIAISQILIETNFLKREKLIKKFAERTDFTQKAILQEIDKYTQQKELITSVREVIESKETLVNDINKFEEKVWKRQGELLGLDTGWKNFNRICDGLQEGSYILGGRTNIGKSAWMLSLKYNLLQINRNKIYILYFTIDDSTPKCLARMIAMKSRISINAIKNPKYKITLSDKYTEAEKESMLKIREESINYIKSLTQSLIFKNINEIESVVKTIKIYNKICENEGKKLIVFVDKIHNLGSWKKLSKRELTEYVSVELKNVVNTYEIPLIGSLEVTKASILARPTEADYKESAKCMDDADLAMLLYSDSKVTQDSMFVFNEGGMVMPILEVSVPKNKLSDLSGYDVRMFFRFYPHLSWLEECNDDECSKFSSIKI
jgi:DNA primase catalytic core